jgi:YD repeat-containing protein
MSNRTKFYVFAAVLAASFLSCRTGGAFGEALNPGWHLIGTDAYGPTYLRSQLGVTTKMTKTLVMAAILLIPTAAMAQQKIFYDASGRVIGTATTSGNQTTFRDDRGRTTGRSATDTQGTTTFYDASGRVEGRTSKR